MKPRLKTADEVAAISKACDTTAMLEREFKENHLTSEARETLLVERETQKIKKERAKWDKYYETKVRNNQDDGEEFKQRDSEIIRPKGRQTTMPKSVTLLTS